MGDFGNGKENTGKFLHRKDNELSDQSKVVDSSDGPRPVFRKSISLVLYCVQKGKSYDGKCLRPSPVPFRPYHHDLFYGFLPGGNSPSYGVVSAGEGGRACGIYTRCRNGRSDGDG